jgi:hypothetical protein
MDADGSTRIASLFSARIAVGIVAIIAAAAGAAPAGAAPATNVRNSPGNPLLGRWVLDVGRSHYGGGAEPRKRETFTVRASGDGVSCTIESVRQDGRALIGRFTAAYDGVPRPASGIPDIDQVALRRVDAHVADATFSLRGRPVFAYRAVRSGDGRTLTIVSVDPKTRAVGESVIVYERR